MLTITASAFCCNLSAPKLTLPIPKWIILAGSTRYSTRPALASLMALGTSVVMVPLLGLGIRPLGPSNLAYLPRRAIKFGLVIKTSKSVCSLSSCASKSASPAMSAPAALALATSSPSAKTATRSVLPVPAGKVTLSRTFWSAWVGSTPRLTWSSTVASNLVVDVFVAKSNASAKGYSRPFTTNLAISRYFLPARSTRLRGGFLASFGASGATFPVLIRSCRACSASASAIALALCLPAFADAFGSAAARNSELGISLFASSGSAFTFSVFTLLFTNFFLLVSNFCAFGALGLIPVFLSTISTPRLLPFDFAQGFGRSLIDLNAHTAGGAGDHFFNSLYVFGVHIGGFGLGYFGQLGLAQFLF